MAWKIDFTASAEKTLEKMDPQVAKRIIKFLRDKVAIDPKAIGDPLQGTLSEFWRYRVGDWRILCTVEDAQVRVLVVKIGHRREVYK